MFSESTEFEVEPLRGLDLRTLRYGAQLGFGRGPYRSRDLNYDLNFETTPTSYGLLFRGGSEKDIWDLSVLGSDFTVRGAVRRSAEISGAYSWRLTENNRHKIDVFFGGSTRFQQTPRIISPDGTNISESTLAMIDLGLTASIQRRFDFQITLYSQGTVDFPIYSSAKYDFDAKQLSYKASAGLLFGLFWPLGFGGELQYRVDRSATKSGSNVIEINQSSLGIMANMMYSL